MNNVDEEELMNDARREVTGTGRSTIEMIVWAVPAAAGSSDVVANT
jgi:hypothetical protein